MSVIHGRSVRLFLVEGKPTGLITGEIINWTGHVLVGLKADLPKFIARPEVSRTGIYLLYGPDPDNLERKKIYIGESDHVGERLKEHNKKDDKIYWERTCVVVSKDQNITKAHARYLEARLIEIAKLAKRARLANETSPPLPPLPEADRSDMEYFIEQIRLVLPVVGLDVFHETPQTSAVPAATAGFNLTNQITSLYELTGNNGVKAEARQIEGEFIVLKGAKLVANWHQEQSAATGYAKLHQQLLDSGKLVVATGDALGTLMEDVAFSSPSAAATVIFGQQRSGPQTWRVKGSQITYGAQQEQQIQANLNQHPLVNPDSVQVESSEVVTDSEEQGSAA